jgi:hypothetical protein
VRSSQRQNQIDPNRCTIPQMPDLVPIQQRGQTVFAERRPSHCSAGHRLAPGRVIVAWYGCSCSYPAASGHRTYLCQTLVDGRECGLIIAVPEHRPVPDK